MSSRKFNKKRLVIYVAITLFCGLFSAIYEHFSHGIYSNYMVYLFTIPLVLGVVPQLAAIAAPWLSKGVSNWQKMIHNFAVATLAVGSVLTGVLEIYGTTSSYTKYYFIVGFALLATSMTLWLIKLLKPKTFTKA